MLLVFGVITTICMVTRIDSRPTGAPVGVCMNGLRPSGHDSLGAMEASDPPGGFYIYSELYNDGNMGAYTAEANYRVTLATSGDLFRGFVIQARENGTDYLVGQFSLVAMVSQFLSCSADYPYATVTHTVVNTPRSYITFYWTAPNRTGVVDFRYTVVTQPNEDYYSDLSALVYRPPCEFPPTLPGDHTLRFGLPDGCMGSGCDYYVGLRQNYLNDDYLDVYLDGEAAGWVAIGFSEDTVMREDDVIGCRVDNTMVIATDTWNIAGTRNNEADATQTDICQQSGSFSDGRITCSFARQIMGADAGQDYNLNASFWFFFGRRLSDQGAAMNFASHRVDGINPMISAMRYNAVLDSNVVVVDPGVAAQCEFMPGPDCFEFSYGMRGGDYFVGTRINPYNSSYVDFYMEGNANGWIALGLSQNTLMEADDVLGCRVSDGNVIAVDTWNPMGRYTPNQIDDTQTDICMHSGSFSDGRIYCRFSRLIIGGNPEQDYNLDEAYWLFYGLRAAGQPSTVTFLGYHSMNGGATPTISANQELLINRVFCPFQPGTGANYAVQVGTSGQGDYYLATELNPNDQNYVDIVLEGVAEGWVAVGLSENRMMENDDVLACRVDNDTVVAVDTWNPSPRWTANEIDDTQGDICMHSSTFTDGRITCRFSRCIQGNNPGQDYNLNSMNWLFYGRRLTEDTNDLDEGLGSHRVDGINPTISEQRFNIAPVPDPVVMPSPTPGPVDGQCDFGFGGNDDDYAHTFTAPDNSYLIRTRINPENRDWLEVYLEGQADGWVAVGLSENTLMEEDDVIGCRNDDGTITVIDTWNPTGRRTPNVRDATQEDICVHTASFNDGRISCRFSRLLTGGNSNQDYDLTERYWAFYGRRNAEQTTGDAFGTHVPGVPTISTGRVNLSSAGTIGSSLILMIAAVAIVLKVIY